MPRRSTGPTERTRLGLYAQELARRHLEAGGFRTLAENVRYRVGELDIVGIMDESLVAVEVRSRTGSPSARLRSPSPRQRRSGSCGSPTRTGMRMPTETCRQIHALTWWQLCLTDGGALCASHGTATQSRTSAGRLALAKCRDAATCGGLSASTSGRVPVSPCRSMNTRAKTAGR